MVISTALPRPGLLIRDVLSGRRRLVTRHDPIVGQTVDRAAVSDLHYTYKEAYYRAREIVPAIRRRRPMTYWSFATYMRFARALGLVEVAGTEDVGTGASGLLSIRRDQTGAMEVVPSQRVLYRLTEAGANAPDEVWEDLTRAYRDMIAEREAG